MSEGKPNRGQAGCGVRAILACPEPGRVARPEEDIESLALLYVCDELEPGERAALDAHAAACPSCAAVLAREWRLQEAIARHGGFDQPANSLDRSGLPAVEGLLLARCRSELAEALDDLSAKSNWWRAIFSPVAWWSEVRDTLIYRPAMGIGIAVLVLAAFLAGHWSQRFRVPPATTPPGQPTLTASDTPADDASARATLPGSGQASTARAPSRLTDEQLRRADRAHVEWVTPSGSGAPTVQVELMSQTPLHIVGAPGDQDVERALTYLLENSQRFDPGTLVDSLDVLATRAADPGVRRTLCAAARGDQNPGVRLKALEALQGFEWDPMVHETLLDALQSDESSWVRAEAINLLVSALQSQGGAPSPDPQSLDVLRDRLRNDPNPYVRAQSAAALRQLGQQ